MDSSDADPTRRGHAGRGDRTARGSRSCRRPLEGLRHAALCSRSYDPRPARVSGAARRGRRRRVSEPVAMTARRARHRMIQVPPGQALEDYVISGAQMWVLTTGYDGAVGTLQRYDTRTARRRGAPPPTGGARTAKAFCDSPPDLGSSGSWTAQPRPRSTRGSVVWAPRWTGPLS